MRSMLIRTAAPAALAAMLAAPAMAGDMNKDKDAAGGYHEQAQAQGQMEGQGQMQAQQFDDQMLQSFAAAASGIRNVAQEYAPRLQDAESPEQAAELEQEAQDAMMQQVQDEGLTVEQYNQIAVAAQQNPQLAQTIQGYIEDGAGGGMD